MLTKNYYARQVAAVSGISYPVVSGAGETFNQAEISSGVSMPSFIAADFKDAIAFSCIVAGTGTAAPNLDDYNLSGDIIASLKCLSDTAITTEIDGGLKNVRTLYLQNIGSDDVTIGEVAWFDYFTYRSGYVHTVMLDRTVLETPMTIPAGQTGKVDYIIIVRVPDEERGD